MSVTNNLAPTDVVNITIVCLSYKVHCQERSSVTVTKELMHIGSVVVCPEG